MKDYFNSVVVTVIVCQVVSVFSPNNDSAKKYIRLLCALSVLLTLISPAMRLSRSMDSIIADMSRFLTAGSTDEGYSTDDELKRTAYVVMTAVSERFGIKKEGIRSVIITDEDGEICEIQIYVDRSPYSTREQIERELKKEIGIPIHVFSNER